MSPRSATSVILSAAVAIGRQAIFALPSAASGATKRRPSGTVVSVVRATIQRLSAAKITRATSSRSSPSVLSTSGPKSGVGVAPGRPGSYSQAVVSRKVSVSGVPGASSRTWLKLRWRLSGVQWR